MSINAINFFFKFSLIGSRPWFQVFIYLILDRRPFPDGPRICGEGAEHDWGRRRFVQERSEDAAVEDERSLVAKLPKGLWSRDVMNDLKKSFELLLLYP